MLSGLITPGTEESRSFVLARLICDEVVLVGVGTGVMGVTDSLRQETVKEARHMDRHRTMIRKNELRNCKIFTPTENYNGSILLRFRMRRNIKNGAPTNADIIPTRNSAGSRIVRAIVSARTRNNAPPNALTGIRTR